MPHSVVRSIGFVIMDTSSTDRGRIAIICALEREIAPLVTGWNAVELRIGESVIKAHQSEHAVAAAAGISKEHALDAAKVLVERFSPTLLISAGLAGALSPELKPGQGFIAAQIIDASSRRSWSTPSGTAVLVTADLIAGAQSKRELAARFHAQAVDMEAAAVAEVAAEHGIPFLAVKAVSDPHNFEMPPLEPFIMPDGRFNERSFAFYIAARPWLWLRAWQLGRNSGKAICALQHLLEQLISGELPDAIAVKSEQGIPRI
jgi:adenosylhomocysteine nucleosidase